MLLSALSGPWGPTKQASTEELSAALQASRPALRALLARVLRCSVGHADVDDCEAEVWRRALEGHSRLRRDTPWTPWLLGIGRHVALDVLRSRGRLAPEEAAPEVAAPSADNPRARLLERELGEQLQGALDELPEKQRQALVLFHLEGRSYRDIARELDAPLGSVCTWICRARQQVAHALREHEDSSDA